MEENPTLSTSPLIVYHVVIEGKPQYEIGQVVLAPFVGSRSYTHWPIYKQRAEEILERYRHDNCPTMPSRNDCLFVSKDLDMNESWIRSKYRQGAIYYQYELEIVEGEPIYLDTDWFEELCTRFSEGEIPSTHKGTIEECIKSYWHGESFSSRGGSLLEGLFYGTAKVTSKKKIKFNRFSNTFIEIK